MKWASEPQEEQDEKKKCTRADDIKNGVSEQCWMLKKTSRLKTSNIKARG